MESGKKEKNPKGLPSEKSEAGSESSEEGDEEFLMQSDIDMEESEQASEEEQSVME